MLRTGSVVAGGIASRTPAVEVGELVSSASGAESIIMQACCISELSML
jgi:hypothetical protein